MRRFGTLPRSRFTPPKSTRGGGFNPDKPKEAPLSGKVQGLKAAQGEERFARTLEKGMRKGLVRKHYFRWTTLRRGVVGYKELDELVFKSNGDILAVSVKGTDFVHRNARDKEQDKINEVIILSKLRELGLNVMQITSIPADKLKTQEDADKVGRSLGVYR